MKFCILSALLISCISVVSCIEENRKYFNGEIIVVDTGVIPDTLRGEKITIDGLYAGNMWAYDTLIGFLHHEFPDYCMHVFNVNTGKFIYPLCKRGPGPGEFPDITYTNQTVYEEQLYFWIRKESGRDECVLINLEKPDDMIKQKMETRIETEFQFPFSFVFILNDSLFLANNQGEEQYQGKGSFIPPAYHIYNSRTKERLKSYKPYNGFVPLSDRFYEMALYVDCYYSVDRIKPDKSKLVMAMELMDQINILDLTTGEVKGYKNKQSPDFSYLRSITDNLKAYYTDLCVDDRYIYGLYSVTHRSGRNFDTNIINVFDWDGNFIKKIALDKVVLDYTLDPVNKFIYINTLSEDDEEIYRYDLSYLYN
jgi:hypothetical protein